MCGAFFRVRPCVAMRRAGELRGSGGDRGHPRHLPQVSREVPGQKSSAAAEFVGYPIDLVSSLLGIGIGVWMGMGHGYPWVCSEKVWPQQLGQLLAIHEPRPAVLDAPGS